jgi:hypothetical protein
MEDTQEALVQTIWSSMAESARPGFSDADIEDLGNLISVTVRFQRYLQSAPVFPATFTDGFDEMIYAIDSILFHIDSFRNIVHAYGPLFGAKQSRLDRDAITVASLKEQFLSTCSQFLAETKFEDKCRLLLDSYKLQLLFAAVFYDCSP